MIVCLMRKKETRSYDGRWKRERGRKVGEIMEGMSWIMVPSIQSQDGMTSHHHSDDEIKGPSHWLSLSLSHKFNCSFFLLILRAVNLSIFSIPYHFLCSFRYLVFETLSSPFSRGENKKGKRMAWKERKRELREREREEKVLHFKCTNQHHESSTLSMKHAAV